jgi:hypothetical protein
MDNTDYKKAGFRAGERDALERENRGAARAWFHHVAERHVLDSPAGRHVFEAAYELSYARRESRAASRRTQPQAFQFAWGT